MEAQVLEALRRADGPVSAAWVQERLGGDLAYTTVMTILSRLHAKGAVSRDRAGRSFLWLPTSDVAGLAALRMRRLLDGEDDRGAVLARFVSGLSADDERLLRGLLDEAAPDGPAPGIGPDLAPVSEDPARRRAPVSEDPARDRARGRS
ncbi:BlaI/MecI/CopY family transcriptional regulator [Streptomyces sp. URMC 123]|uniref:BlaI/MecI/CopY family transcriptional regulator n=1 Tax=Streptomyces sp. URMC 123 TaxID=3423403 RepID=UPI003F1AC6F0